MSLLVERLSGVPLDDAHLDRARCQRLKADLLAERNDLLELIERGGRHRDTRTGRLVKPLGKRTIRTLLRTLAQILDQAVHEGFLTSNPARGLTVRLDPPPTRSWLEMDELADLLSAASLLGREFSETTARVKAMAQEGHKPPVIAAALGVGVPNVYYHLKKPEPEPNHEARSFITTLAYTGVRVREALNQQVGHLRLHAEPHQMVVMKSKTKAGHHEVPLFLVVREELIGWLMHRANLGLDTGPTASLWTGAGGQPRSYSWALGLLRDAAALASKRRVLRGLPPLPEKVTPHTLRHTFISIALLGYDKRLVMSWVGHEDKATMDRIYDHLLTRKHDDGAAFDAQVEAASEHVGDGKWSWNWSRGTNWHLDAQKEGSP
jgi:integrase